MDRGRLFLVDKNSVPPPIQLSPPIVPRLTFKQVVRNLGISGAEYHEEDWRPATVRRWASVIHALFLASIVGALISIYMLSRGLKLYQSGLDYQDNIIIGNHLVTSVTPYSIIPTLVASIVKLMWPVLEDVSRRLSPFLAMVQHPRKPSDGVALSYATTPILWITAVAAKRGHWLPALVTLGSFFTAVLTVSHRAKFPPRIHKLRLVWRKRNFFVHS